MAELIDKKTAIDTLSQIGDYAEEKGMKWSKGVHRSMVAIEAMPNTTEAEIRAKAIDEFAKALLINEVVDKSVVRRVAEQLKEE